VLYVVDAAAEGESGELAGVREIQFRAIGPAARRRVDEHAEAANLVGVDVVATRLERGHDLAGVDEQRELVGIDDRLAIPANADIRPFVDDDVLVVVGNGDELTSEQCHDSESSTGMITPMLLSPAW